MKKVIKRSAIVLGVLLALLVVLFLVVTSDAFVRKVILPRAGKAIGEPVSAEKLSFSPRKHLLIEGLQIGESDDFRISIPAVTVRYKFFPLLRGDLVVEEVRISDFNGSVKRMPELPEKKKKKKKKKKKGGKPSQISISNVIIENANLIYAPNSNPGQILEVKDFNLRIPLLTNSTDFEIDIDCGLRIKRAAADAVVETVSLSVKGTLGPEMLPSRIQSALLVDGTSGNVGDIDLADRKVNGEIDLTWLDNNLAIKQFLFAERIGEVVEASLQVDGELTFSPPEGNLNLTVDLPDPSLLNLIGGFAGDYDFGRTSAKLRTHIGSGDKPFQLKFDGDLAVNNASFSSAELGVVAISPLNFSLDWGGYFDVTRLQAVLEKADMRVVEGHEIASLSLVAPGGLPISGGGKGLPTGTSLKAKIDRLDLSRYVKALPSVPALKGIAGIVDVEATLQPDNDKGQWQSKGSVRLSKIQCPQISSATPLDASVSFAGSYLSDGMATIQQMAVTLGQSGGSNILDLQIAGQFDTALQGRKSELAIESRQAIRVDELLALARAPSEAPEQSPPNPVPVQSGKTIPGLPPGLWVELSAAIPEISYGEISATGLNFSARLKDGILQDPQEADGESFEIGVDCGLRIKRASTDAALKTVSLSMKGTLGPDMVPSRMQSALIVDGASGNVRGIDLTGRNVRGDVDLTWLDDKLTIKQFLFVERIGEMVEASLQAGGDLAFSPAAGNLDLTVDLPDSSLLNLIGSLAGDYDFGKTSAKLRGQIGAGTTPSQMKFAGDLAVSNASFSSAKLGVAPISPLNLALGWSGYFETESLQAVLEKADVRVVDGHEIVKLSLAAPGGIPISGGGKDLPAGTSLKAKIERLDLSKYVKALPNVPALKGIAGIVNVDATVQPGSGEGQWQSKGNLKLSKLQCPQISSEMPLDASVSFAGSYLSDGMATIQQMAVVLGQSGQSNILDLQMAGRLDTALQGRKSELAIESRQAIRVDELLALAPPRPEAPEQSPPNPAPEKPGEIDTGLPPGLWVELSATIPEISYGEISASDLKLAATLKDGILRCPQSTFIFTGKPASVNAEVDLSNPALPVYKGGVKLGYVSVAPFINTFKPNFPVKLTGGLQDLSLSFSGRGSDPKLIRENMQADLDYGIDNFKVVSMPPWASLLSSQLLALLELRPDDLRFDGGLGNVSLKDGRLTVAAAEFNAALWRLKAEGSMAIGGEPDFKITPLFRGISAKRLADENIPLESGTDGFQAAPTILLRGPIWQKLHAARLITDYAVSLGKVDKEAQAVGQGLDILKGVLGNTKKGEKLDVEETTKGVKGIIDLFEKK